MELLQRCTDALAARAGEPAPLALIRRFGRALLALSGDLLNGELLDRAASLAYTTLLSLVPLLAVSFSVLQAFGAHNALEPLLRDALVPLGSQGEEVATRILEFVGRMQVGVLGSLGVLLLLYTVVSTIHKIELAFNSIWDIPRPRTMARRVVDYLSVTLVGPVLAFFAIGLSDTARRTLASLSGTYYTPLASAGGMLLAYVPQMLGLAGFVFIYAFLPNTRVRLPSALIGGLFGMLLWTVAGRLFAALMADSGNYPAIYSGFAGAVLFILWLNVSWIIVLAGAGLSRHWQAPRRAAPGTAFGPAAQEALAFTLMTTIAEAHLHGRPAPNDAALVQASGLPASAVDAVLGRLQAAGLICPIDTLAGGWLPARDAHSLALTAILDAVRGPAGASAHAGALMGELDTAARRRLDGRTLGELIAEPQAQR